MYICLSGIHCYPLCYRILRRVSFLFYVDRSLQYHLSSRSISNFRHYLRKPCVGSKCTWLSACRLILAANQLVSFFLIRYRCSLQNVFQQFEFHENGHSDNHTLLKGVNEFHLYLLTDLGETWNRIAPRNVLIRREFRESRRSECHTLRKCVSKFLPYLPHFWSHLAEIWYKRSADNAVGHL